MHEQTQQKKINWLIVLGIAEAVLLLGLLVFFFAINRFSLSLELSGPAQLEIPYGSSVSLPDPTPRFTGSLVLKKGILPRISVLSQGAVDTDTVGTYRLTYRAQYLLWTGEVSRTVRVVDRVVPEITLVADPGHRTAFGQLYQEEGFKAWDEYDGDITDHVQREERDGLVVYTVADSSGNVATAYRTIEYYDPVPPQIQLKGDAACTVQVGSTFADPGFTATDNYDGDITARVTVAGEVVPYRAGTYELTYTVTDSFGNTATARRTVTVVPRPPVQTQYPGQKVIYLTFDDGPSAHTGRLLDILAKYDVKATFFITGTGNYGALQRMAQEGHSLGVHTVSHRYSQVYASEEAYFADLYTMQDIIYQHTGVKTTLIRFPGGSSNSVSAKYNKGIMTRLTKMVQDAGLQYFDWNVDSQDAAGANTADAIFRNVVQGIGGRKYCVVLQHDIYGCSVDAVERIIIWGLENGYTFLPLAPDSPSCHHGVYN